MTLFERLEGIRSTSHPYKYSKFSYRIASPEEAAIYQQLWDGMAKDSERREKAAENGNASDADGLFLP